MNNISAESSLPPRKRSLLGSPSGSNERNRNNNNNLNNGLPYATSGVAWKGSFIINDPGGTKQTEMLAYYSKKVHIEVIEFASKFPANLEMRIFDRSNACAWPKKFDLEPPMKDDIGFYFFPQNEIHHKKYLNIIRYLDSGNRILKIILQRNFELRVFSSELLQPQFRSLNGSAFLWGVIVKCKKMRNKKRHMSVTKQKHLSEIYSQNILTTKNCHEEIPKTPIALDKRAQNCNVSIKKEMEITDIPPGFGGVTPLQKPAQTSKEIVLAEPKQKQCKYDFKANFEIVGLDQFLRAQNLAQRSTQDEGLSNACLEQISRDESEPNHSETNAERNDQNSEYARKNVVIKQETDPINYARNQLGQVEAQFGPVVLAEPSRRSESQEGEDSSSPPDSARRNVGTGRRGITNESSPKLQAIVEPSSQVGLEKEDGSSPLPLSNSETNVDQSSSQSKKKKADTPVTTTPVNELGTSNVGTSSNSANQQVVPRQPETTVASIPLNTVEVKREAGIKFALKPSDPSRSHFNLFSNWRSPLMPNPSPTPQPQLQDYKPPTGPRFGNPHLFNPSCSRAQNLRPQIRPRIADREYMNQFQVPLVSSPQDLRPQISLTNGDHFNQGLRPQISSTNGDYLNQNRGPQIGPTNGDHFNQGLRPQISSTNGDYLNQNMGPQIGPTNGDQQYLNQGLRPQFRPPNGNHQLLNQNLRPQISQPIGSQYLLIQNPRPQFMPPTIRNQQLLNQNLSPQFMPPTIGNQPDHLNQQFRPPVRPTTGNFQYVNQLPVPIGDLQWSLSRASPYHCANLSGLSPHIRVFSNPPLIKNEANNGNRSYPVILPKLEPDYRLGEAKGSSRGPSREDDNSGETIISRRPSREDNNNRGKTVISRRSRSPVRRRERRSPARRRSKSPVRNRRRERNRSYSPMSSSSLWRGRSPSRSPPCRQRRGRDCRRRIRRRSRSLERYMRSKSPNRGNRSLILENRASSRSFSPQARSGTSPEKYGTK